MNDKNNSSDKEKLVVWNPGTAQIKPIDFPCTDKTENSKKSVDDSSEAKKDTSKKEIKK